MIQPPVQRLVLINLFVVDCTMEQLTRKWAQYWNWYWNSGHLPGDILVGNVKLNVQSHDLLLHEPKVIGNGEEIYRALSGCILLSWGIDKTIFLYRFRKGFQKVLDAVTCCQRQDEEAVKTDPTKVHTRIIYALEARVKRTYERINSQTVQKKFNPISYIWNRENMLC